MQDKSSATARIQRNHQTTKPPNHLPLLLGYWENPNNILPLQAYSEKHPTIYYWS